MQLASTPPPLGRSDRHVLRARMRVGTGAPRHRLAFNIEEALRLCTLPGEEEGRVYYFRRLCIDALPEDGDRRAWLGAFQHGLLELARGAVHGSERRAPGADAVFFRNEQEACESLLALIVQRRPADAWFWPAVSGTPAGASPARLVVALVEKLLRVAPSWVAVAAAVFAAIDQGGAGALLRLLPDQAVARWLGELGSDDAGFDDAAPIRFTAAMRKIVAQAAADLGAEDSRVVWLASLAVVLAFPSELARGAVPSWTRLVLQTIGRADPEPQLPSDDSPVRPDHCFGEATEGAGLYFLLNVVRSLKTDDETLDASFLAHFFQHAARHAGVASDDPILLWTLVILDEVGDVEIDERRVRVWLVKVRRWCWRNANISIRDIVRRPGRVTLTRTDLDVALPLGSVDIRIRRSGLDIDPGWLPWFGRVVRFHYLARGELHA